MNRINRSGVLFLLALPATVWPQGKAAAPPRPAAKAVTPAKPVPVTRATAEQIAGWVGQLTSRDFRARRTASKRLVAAGIAVIDQVARAADGDDLERTTRCLAVLKQLQSSGDAATKAAAGAALKRLATSKNATVARRAEAALPKPDPKSAVGGKQLGGLRVLGFRAVNANRVSVRVINGQRTIEVKEGTRKILINDTNGKDIRVTITDKPNGKVESREVKAVTAEELKKADAEAYKLYQQYTARNGLQIKIQRFGPAVPGNLRRALPLRGGRPVLPLPRFSPWHQQVESARKQVDLAIARLKKLAAQPQAKPGELREVLEQLVDAQKTLSVLLAEPRQKPSTPKAKGVPPKPRRPTPNAKPKVIKTRGA